MENHSEYAAIPPPPLCLSLSEIEMAFANLFLLPALPIQVHTVGVLEP